MIELILIENNKFTAKVVDRFQDIACVMFRLRRWCLVNWGTLWELRHDNSFFGYHAINTSNGDVLEIW